MEPITVHNIVIAAIFFAIIIICYKFRNDNQGSYLDKDEKLARDQNKVLNLLLNSSIAIGKPISFYALPDEKCGQRQMTHHLHEPVDKDKESNLRIRKGVRYKDIGGDPKLLG